MAYELPALPYQLNALQPYISQETLEYHYGKHHQTYVNNLNNLVPASEFEGASLEEIITNAPAGAIFNNAAQIWNHTFYFEGFKANGGGKPNAGLLSAIEKQFDSFEKFQQQFSETAIKLFGSGWAWLVKTANGDLDIVGTANADNPITDGHTPLLTCDVWEHAYYIDVRNARPKYVENFWQIVNWDFVEDNLQA